MPTADNYAKYSLIFIFLFLISQPIGFASVSSLQNKSLGSYSFENFPVLAPVTVSDFSNNSRTLTASSFSVQNSFTVKLGAWATVLNGTEFINYTNNQQLPQFNISIGANNSVSAWFYLPQTINSLTDVNNVGLYTIGTDVYMTTVMINNQTHINITTQTGTCGTAEGVKIPYTVNTGEWYHIVTNLKRSINGTHTEYDLYINNQLIQSGFFANGFTPAAPNSSRLNMGKLPYYGASCANRYPLSHQTKNVYIDQLDVFSNSLSTDEIALLYNGGEGLDIYSSATPATNGEIPDIFLGYNQDLATNLDQYFTDETYILIEYEYPTGFRPPYVSSYYAVQDQDNYTGNLLSFPKFYTFFSQPKIFRTVSYNSALPPINILARGCNDNGCSLPLSFQLSIGFTEGGIIQTGTVPDLILPENFTRTLFYGDYFNRYTNRYLQYRSPDTGLNVISQSGDNSCFSFTITGDNLVLNTKSINCTVTNAYLVVEDGADILQSNVFTISVQNAQTSAGAAVTQSLGRLFPDSSTLTPQARLNYVLIVMGITALISVFALWNSNSGFVAVGFGSLLFIEFIYFTSIGYIPILWIALFGVLVTVAGVAWFTNKTVGTNG
jgi:hypothetical protein